MANVSFANLDRNFDMSDSAFTAFSGTSGTFAFSDYSYVSTGSDDWEFGGSGITDNGTVPTGGTVSRLAVDLDDENDLVFEVDITGMDDISILDFGINSGSANDQNNSFWAAALQGDDVFDFTGADVTVDVDIAGDGADVADGQIHIGGADTFQGAALTSSSQIFGDFLHVENGTAVGGDDLFTMSTRVLLGDFFNISSGATAFGGDDTFTPLDHDYSSTLLIMGDANNVSGTMSGGDDLIDIRNTDLSDFSGSITLYGDAFTVGISGLLVGGDDTMHGSAQEDRMFGERTGSGGTVTGGDDLMFGYAGDDTLNGNTGNDTLVGGEGADSLNGGDGLDLADYSSSSAVTVALNTGATSGGEAVGDTFTDVEGLIGSNFNDGLAGDANDNLLFGGSGNDEMVGRDGDDTLFGQDGNDIMYGGAGNDVIEGAANNDFASGGSNNDIINGGAGADSLYGGANNDSISGGTGGDDIFGSKGVDTLLGGGGNDLISGAADNDFIDGGAGNDTLFGGRQNDLITGGDGDDVFLYSATNDLDVITDFTAGAGTDDVVDVSGFGTAFDTFAEIMAVATDDGVDTTINFGGGDAIVLEGVLVADLHTSDFTFS